MRNFKRPIGEGKGNTMKTLLLALIILLFSIPVQAAELRWTAPVETPTEQIGGYIIYYEEVGPIVREPWSNDAGNVTRYDLSNLNLSPGAKYLISASAYSIYGKEGPQSEPVEYTAPKLVISTNPKEPENNQFTLELRNLKITAEIIP